MHWQMYDREKTGGVPSEVLQRMAAQVDGDDRFIVEGERFLLDRFDQDKDGKIGFDDFLFVPLAQPEKSRY